jgi:hypothetical protein
MTQEEKDLLLKDLCARLPYGIKGKLFLFGSDKHTKEINLIGYTKSKGKLFERIFAEDESDYNIEWFKPYLRPMSSMREEEVKEFAALESIDVLGGDIKITCVELSIDAIDWLNKKMFDYRGLIKRGLALEASDGMYKF